MQAPESVLKQYWGYDGFRPVQREAIQSVLDGNDTLLLLPTGGGKSICFQVPAMVMEGVCIVVTPLIALMKDQVDQLRKREIPASCIHSGMNSHEIDIILDNCIHGNVKFLYVSPERLRTEIMIERTKLMKVNLLAIDEAHCISAWGYDFRPSYLLISDFRAFLPKVPVMALTATATEEVRKDIVDKLLMKSAILLKQSFARENLSYSGFRVDSKERKLLQILNNVKGTSIIYVKTRKRTRELATWLKNQGVSSDAYHAGLTFKERTDRQIAWIKNQIRVIVSTNAFGMGIDKPDVRSVIHFDLPENLEAYYQEAGRAGRDQKKAYAIALFNQIDLEELVRNVEKSYPPLEFLKRVYQALANYYKIPIGGGELVSFDFDMQDFTGIFGLPVMDTHHALKLLEMEGFVQLSENFNEPSRLLFLVDNRQLYDFQIRYPEMDSFVKVILRIYGGESFSEYVRISESELAQYNLMPVNEVLQKIKFLAERQVIDYIPRKNKPQLLFMTPRFDPSYLPLNLSEINRRKARDLYKANAVVGYTSNNIRCRTAMLLEYFNEFDAKECGVCDNCLQNKKSSAGNNSIKEEILIYLSQNGARYPREIIKDLAHINENVLANEIRQLIENETIAYGNDEKILINQNSF